jgi:hypothetical protein
VAITAATALVVRDEETPGPPGRELAPGPDPV